MKTSPNVGILGNNDENEKTETNSLGCVVEVGFDKSLFTGDSGTVEDLTKEPNR